MVDIIVQRSPADLPGDDIVEPLLADVVAARERGRVEIDGSWPYLPVEVEVQLPPGEVILPGDIVGVEDLFRGEVYQAQVTAVRHRDDGAVPSTTLSLWRPLV